MYTQCVEYVDNMPAFCILCTMYAKGRHSVYMACVVTIVFNMYVCLCMACTHCIHTVWCVCVVGFQDIVFLPSRASVFTTFLKNCGRGESLKTSTCPKTVFWGK